jgi:hypothetical protein
MCVAERSTFRLLDRISEVKGSFLGDNGYAYRAVAAHLAPAFAPPAWRPVGLLGRVIIACRESAFCRITYLIEWAKTQWPTSVFDAAAKALRWSEIDCQAFETARRFRDDQISFW